jgi:hypothetical protein
MNRTAHTAFASLTGAACAALATLAMLAAVNHLAQAPSAGSLFAAKAAPQVVLVVGHRSQS